MRVEPLTSSFGCVVSGATMLTSTDVPALKRLLREHGAVMLREACSSVATFEAVTHAFGDRFLHHGNPARVPAPGDGFTISVTPGGGSIDVHSEMAYSPLHPSAIWFYCAMPAATGGDTMLCDGVELFDRLPQDVQHALRRHLVTYTYNDMARWWQFLGMADRKTLPTAAQFSGAVWEVDGNGNVSRFAYSTSAVHRGLNGLEAFAASLLDKGYSFDEAYFDGVTPIPEHLLFAIRDVARSLQVRVRLGAADVLLLDNNRVLHGRTGYDDVARKVYLRLANFTV